MSEPDLQPKGPSSAGTWCCLSGGRIYTEADKDLAEAIGHSFPVVPAAARASRAFLRRLVDHAVRAGVTQFLDLGTGLPVDPNTHEVAQAVERSARIVYVDNDPTVIEHARALASLGTPEGVAGYLDADVRDVPGVLGEAAKTLDLDRPVAVLMISMLGHIEDPAEAGELAHRYMGAVPSGSYFATCDSIETPDMRAAAAAYAAGGGPPVYLRTAEQLEITAAGLELLGPVGPVSLWRPAEPSPQPVDQWGLVARKP
ncbi:SAM-dependent methyltransferase [Streptomyces sp. NBC_01498]|uniref:SAM-dependent methyltransferase n=1 Tax=Streptomyces sp. NBC_01498 TaxID=2975870 RepID=UPI002E7C5201|nr:SAM-dependent methyltransferase [Streptomyces sp. NBC_01498]WTL26129.1 SAM-dependent methyltransferase [Streptomyces sp. NBC_01498]